VGGSESGAQSTSIWFGVAFVATALAGIVMSRRVLKWLIDSRADAVFWALAIAGVGTMLVAIGGRHLYRLRPVTNPPSMAKRVMLAAGAVLLASAATGSLFRGGIGWEARRRYRQELHNFSLYYGGALLVVAAALIALTFWDGRRARRDANTGS
jgi:hypothetical protein